MEHVVMSRHVVVSAGGSWSPVVMEHVVMSRHVVMSAGGSWSPVVMELSWSHRGVTVALM